ncbi:MAG TPA: DEAD/DEAH box helicase family protein, partial [Candidatus Spyradenecus faecavium]|nr:DEAD/DEAH box helicase family protein [Candidatus Spyradenecus faecavium]
MPQAGLFAPDEASRAALAAVYERLWAQGTDVKAPLRAALAALYAPNAPRFIYFLSLWHLFHDRLPEWRGAFADDRRLEETPIWKALYAFQRHGAIAALRKLKKDGGCILADSVGLGKTYTALAVIKAYERMNRRVLVLCPKKLRTNWLRFLQDDEDNPLPTLTGRSDFFYALLNHTDLSLPWVDPGRGMRVSREDFFRKDFGLIVIDESHNFRNRGGKRYRFLLDYLKAHPKTKLLLLSATPVSNRLSDLTHQLGLVYRGDEPPSGPFLREVVAVVSAAQRLSTQWSRTHADDPEQLSAATLANVLPPTYFRLLERYTIARSQSGISKFYADAETEIGVFPKCKSLSCYPEIDTQSARVDVTTLSDRLNDLTLVAYNPTHCLRAGIRWHEEEEGKQLLDKNRQKSLTALMRINALKRLESSVDSFRRTVRDAVLARTQAQLEALAKGTVRLPWVTAKALLGEAEAKRQAKAAALGIDPDTLDEDDEALAEGLSREVVLPAKQYFDVAALKRYLKQDLGVLKGILDDVESVGPARDAKLAELEHVLQEKVDHPLNPGNEKTLIFSAFADTVEYVAKALAERHPERHIACVSGSKGIVWHGGRAKAEEMGR